MNQQQPGKPALSVVVCTFNRSGILKETLLSLARQTAASQLYEVVVVDNNSTDGTQPVAGLFQERFDNFRLVQERRQGLSHARNRGCREARAAWVAYIDDDARAPENYVERILHTLSRHDFDCLGGVYLPWYKYGKPKWYKDAYASNSAKQAFLGGLPQGKYADGGNCVFKKTTLMAHDGFTPGLGMRAGTVSYGEETHLQRRMRNSGAALGFDPLLVVEHLVSKPKMRPAWFLRSAYAAGRAYWDIFSATPDMGKLVYFFFNGVAGAFLKVARLHRVITSKDYYLQNYFIDLLHPLSYNLGIAVRGLQILKESHHA